MGEPEFPKVPTGDSFSLVVSLEDLGEDGKEIVSSALLEAFPDDFRRMNVSPGSAHSFVTQSFRAHNGMLSLWDGNELVATSAYSLSGSAYFVTNVFVSEKHRGSGIARRMVAEAEKMISAKGEKYARVWCEKPLTPMYEKLGYHVETRDYRASRDRYVDVLYKHLA